MKKLFTLLSVILCLCMLTACAGTPVIYHIGCNCSEDGTTTANPDNTPTLPEGALKTGLAILTSVSGSTTGEAKYESTMVAVLVDDNGVIHDCLIDGLSTSLKFENGQITSDITTAPKTKNELGADYGMVAWAGAVAEWNEQAASFAAYVKGKTLAQVKGIAVNESGKPTDADISASVTIAVGDFISAIEKAVANAKHLGAASGNTLRLASTPGFSSSTSATADAAGNAQFDMDVTALTMKDGVITSCVLDSVQVKVAFNTTDAITSDITAAVQTKNELGTAYNMVAWGGAIAEWNEQAAAFAAYVTGKTPAQVAGIAVDSGTKPTDADLTSSVTIAVGGFQALIQKAAQ